MTRGKKFIEKGKCRSNHCSTMSISAWCELNSKVTHLNYMIFVIILKADVRNKSLLLQDNFNLKAMGWKRQ